MAGVAIRTHELGKRYTLGTKRRGQATMAEYLTDRGRDLARGRVRQPKPEDERTLWALRDVSLDIHHGEAVGLIGHNGAGKSTLLKILTRITEPSEGWGEVTGRVGSLLEVGTGFHPELTGRENIFLNGSILGMSRSEIRRQFDEIVAFAEVERFLDTPVKRYSSGMSVRLAFAVAAHLEPEILLVDEVLAVGDAAFQRKSLGKMSEVAGEGRTVVFVSHNLAIVRALCKRAVLLERGRMVADGPTTATLDDYLRTLERSASEGLAERTDRDSRGWDDIRVNRIEVRDLEGGMPDVVVGGRPARITLDLTGVVQAMQCQVTILDNLGQPITTLTSEVVSPEDTRDPSFGPRIECDIDSLPLLPGRYRVDFLLKGKGRIQDGLQAAAFFDVEPGVVSGRPTPASGADGQVVVAHRWRLPS